MYLLKIFASVMFVSQMASQVAPKNRPEDNFAGVLNRFCPTDTDNLDASCSSSLENFFLNVVDGREFFSKRHINGSDILNLLNFNNYREESCQSFNQSETCIDALIKAQDSCIDQNVIGLKLAIGAYRTMCSYDFDYFLSDVFDKAGDQCLDDVYQEIISPINTEGKKKIEEKKIIEENAACNAIGAELAIAHSKKENFDSLKTQFGARLALECLLTKIQRICGDNGKAQAKRITDMFLENLDF